MSSVYAVIPAVRKRVKKTVENLLLGTLPPEKVVVIENGVKLGIKESNRVKIIHLPENTGSEGGYYAGMKYCLANARCEFIFTSDDDTEYSEDALEKLLFWLKNLPEAGAVRCAWVGYQGGVKEVPSSIWSGVLIKKDVIRKIGLPKREFFIYAGDEEFFTRMRKSGYKIYIIPYARYRLRKREGRTKYKMSYRDPARVYYAFRNEIFLGRTYNPLRIFRVILFFVKVLPFLPPECIISGINGIFDGLKGKLGKNPKYQISL